MKRKDHEDKKDVNVKRHPIIDTLENDIAHAYAILNGLELCIRDNERHKSSECVRCHSELRRAFLQIEALNKENKWLRNRNQELRYQNEELLKFRTPDAYMDMVATALALFPISSASKAYEETGIQYTTINNAAKKLGLVATKEAREEARQRMKELGFGDIEKRGGKNRKPIEMLVNGKVVATFDSITEADKVTGGRFVSYRIKRNATVDGISFRYKKQENLEL